MIEYICPVENFYGKIEVYDTEKEAQAAMEWIKKGIRTGQVLITLG